MRWPTPPTGPDGAEITNIAPRPVTTAATGFDSHDQRSTTAVLSNLLGRSLSGFLSRVGVSWATRGRRQRSGAPLGPRAAADEEHPAGPASRPRQPRPARRPARRAGP